MYFFRQLGKKKEKLKKNENNNKCIGYDLWSLCKSGKKYNLWGLVMMIDQVNAILNGDLVKKLKDTPLEQLERILNDAIKTELQK